MGQHKYNPNAEKVKNGELPPKKKKLSKREADRLLRKKLKESLLPFAFEMEEYWNER